MQGLGLMPPPSASWLQAQPSGARCARDANCQVQEVATSKVCHHARKMAIVVGVWQCVKRLWGMLMLMMTVMASSGKKECGACRPLRPIVGVWPARG